MAELTHREEDRHLEVASVKSSQGVELVLERFDGADDNQRTLNVYSPEGELLLYVSGYHNPEDEAFLRLLWSANFGFRH